MTAQRVLVVDDEESIVQLVTAYLRRAGFEVEAASDGPGALAMVRQFRPDVVVLDIMLPGLDGLEVLRRLRQESPAYVIMLTAKAEETDKVVGLAVGADDYVTKPFSPRELTARIHAILRRGRAGAQAPEVPLVFRGLRLDPWRRETRVDDVPVELTTLEFNLLHALASYPGHVLTREQLIERVWGMEYFGDDRVVDVHIRKLRRKLRDPADRPRFIQTIRGVGYKFVGVPA